MPMGPGQPAWTVPGPGVVPPPAWVPPAPIHRHSKVASALGVTVVAVLVSLCSTFLGLPPTSASTPQAAAFVPADGFRVRLADPARPDDLVTVEWAREETIKPIRSGPEIFGWWYLADPDRRSTISLARVSETILRASGAAHHDTLLSITADGVRTNAVQEEGAGRAYVPGKLTIPADVAAGPTWQSSGEVRLLDHGALSEPLPYTTTSVATAPSDAALAAAGCVDITEQETTGNNPPTETITTWCPGRGIVGRAGGDAELRLTDARAPAASITGGFAWDAVDRLEWATFPISNVGRSLAYQSPVAAPGVLRDGTLVYANRPGDDIVAVRTDRPWEPTVWRARPGGGILTAATLGSLTVAVTSERRAVAYGPDGEWLWTAPLTEIARTPPQEFDGGVLVATIDGTVVLLDAQDGSRRWEHQAAGPFDLAPVVAGDSIVVTDQTGQVSRLGVDGEPIWSRQQIRPQLVTVVGDMVVTTPHAGAVVTARRLSDGSQAWQFRPQAAFSGLSGADGILVAWSADEMVGLDATTAALRWRRPLTVERMVAGGGRLVVITPSDLRVVDPTTGRDVRTVDLALGDLSQNGFHLGTGNGSMVVTTAEKVAIGSLR